MNAVLIYFICAIIVYLMFWYYDSHGNLPINTSTWKPVWRILFHISVFALWFIYVWVASFILIGVLLYGLITYILNI